MLVRRFLLVFLLSAVATVNVVAQEASSNNFGDENQPGNRLHDVIVNSMTNLNISAETAIQQSIELALTERDTTLNGESKSAVAFDIPLAFQFYDVMVEQNSLIEVTKTLMELFPDKAVHTITLAVVLYPEYAQEVFDGASLSGVMAADDILIATIQAGADPTSVSDATAAGATAANVETVAPLGAGIGAGGTGGGDTTASTN